MDGEFIPIKQFFQNFLAKEKERSDISNEYLTLLKILFFQLDELITKNKINRRIFILEQIEKYLIDENFSVQIESVDLPDLSKITIPQDTNTPKITLKSIDLVNFRGFRANKDGSGRKIQFNQKATLIFAPNGGGKTSLCESLEWTLTGDTYEHTKRKSDSSSSYFQNRNNSDPLYESTKLTIDGDQSLIPSTIFDRCFLEKNRIDKFARLSMQSNKDLQEILGELFGFSEVVDFVKEFGQDISPTDNEKNRVERENWQTWLDWNSKKIDLEKTLEEVKKEVNEASVNLKSLTKEKSYDNKKTEIEEKVRSLRSVLDNIEKNSSTDFSTKSFQDKISSYLEKIRLWKNYENDILDNAKDLDFESLFQAANSIFKNGYIDNKCPLCDTPVKQQPGEPQHMCVTTDPQLKTEQELKKLEKLTDWKSEKSKLELDLKGQSFRDIRDEWQKIQKNLLDDNWKEIASNDKKPAIPVISFSEIESKLDGETKLFFDACELSFNMDFSKLSDLEQKINSYKKIREELLKEKSKKEEEIQNLREQLSKLQEVNNVLSAKQEIQKSSQERLQKVSNQSVNSERFTQILDAYLSFYSELQNFQSSSILAEGADIDDYVTGFYRALNLNDNESEALKLINFPKGLQEDFCLTYENNDINRCNALDILSEGHLKTLGLAALLARAAKYNASLLIFDDAINAIDSDHRDNIASLLSGSFSDEEGRKSFGGKWDQVKQFINDCQFVITSHDRFFDEKLANLFSKNKHVRYVLYSGSEGVDFCEKGNHANFEAKVESFLGSDTQDIRSAIFYCRIWLEEIVMDIAINFKKLSNGKRLEFSNIIDKKSRKLKNPELGTVLEKLISNLNSPDSSVEDKKISNILDQIYNEKDGKYVWLFEILNQESHYRRLDHVDVSNAPTSTEVQTIFDKIQEISNLNK